MGINICPSCNRFISLSEIPGGNPVAKDDPDVIAMYYAKCENCGFIYCDHCVEKNNNHCPNCGFKVTIQGPSPKRPWWQFRRRQRKKAEQARVSPVNPQTISEIKPVENHGFNKDSDEPDESLRNNIVRAVRSGDPVADAFEDRLLEWLQIRLGVKPVSNQGMNTSFWEFEFKGHKVTLSIIGRKKNTATPPAPGTDWILRVEEEDPMEFVSILEQFFISANRVKRKMSHSGKIRVQFKSTELLPESELA
jgi:hypothetical protein